MHMYVIPVYFPNSKEYEICTSPEHLHGQLIKLHGICQHFEEEITHSNLTEEGVVNYVLQKLDEFYDNPSGFIK